MNKSLLLTSASAFALILAASAPAYADVGARAESQSTVAGNTAIDDGSLRENLIDNSWNGGATGIVHNQQNNGNNNGIGAATAVHADVTGGTSLDTSAHATSFTTDGVSSQHPGHTVDRHNQILDTMNGFVGSATLQQNNGDDNAINAATALDGVDGDASGIDQDAVAGAGVGVGDDLDTGATRENLIDPSFNGAKGVFTVQQNNGNGNGISAATAALGVTGDAGILDQTAIASTGTQSVTTDTSSADPTNLITGSFNEGFAGVATVQQNNGSYNGMAASTAVAGAGGDSGDLTQNAEANKSHAGADSADTSETESWRENQIAGDNPAFNGAQGVITVQQNNGDANAMSSATAVAGIAGNAQKITQGVTPAQEFSSSTANSTDNFGSWRANSIIFRSFDDGTGIFTVQQNNGDANAIGSATAVAAIAGDSGNISQDIVGGSNNTGSHQNGESNILKANGVARRNYIFDTMNGISGVTTVQQNNGNANQIDNAIGLVAVGGTSDDVVQFISANTGSANVTDNRTGTSGNDRYNSIGAALSSYDGILTAQQNNGDANSLSAKTGAVLTNGADTVLQNNLGSGIVRFNVTSSIGDSRTNSILDGVDQLEGIATVQQNNGDANSLVASTGLVFVAGEAGDTDQTVAANGLSASNQLFDVSVDRSNSALQSFMDAQGIATLQQNNGDGNAMTALTSAAANQGGDDLDTTQTISAIGYVESNTTLHELGGEPSRDNLLTSGSFRNLQGIATVQQNNGNGNSVGAATGVIANFGDGLMDDVTSQDVTTDGSAANSSAAHNLLGTFGARLNTATVGIFNSSNGIVTVQQNNGDNNAINAATGVRVEIGATAQTSQDGEDVSSQLAATSGSVAFSDAETTNLRPISEFGILASDRANTMSSSFQGGVNGVFTVQQNNGDNNVIGSATAVVADINNEEDIDSTLSNRASTEGTVQNNLGQNEYGAADLFTGRINEITLGQFNDAAGIVTAQQNNGNNNVIGAATGVAANVNTQKRFGKQVSADADGTATVDNNSAFANRTDRTNLIDDSFVGTQGVMTVQQNNGDNNVIGAATDVVASTELPGFGPAASASTLGATVSGNTTEVIGAENMAWDNTIQSSFTGASGIMTVQQNNGGNNAMGSAITAVANGINFGVGPGAVLN